MHKDLQDPGLQVKHMYNEVVYECLGSKLFFSKSEKA